MVLDRLVPRKVLIPFLATALLLVAAACVGTAPPSLPVLDGNVEKSEIQIPNQESGEILVATPTPVQDPAPVARVETIEVFTLMVASQDNELFNSKYASGENNLWLRLAHV